MMDRVVMLDRDGTINVERHYLSNPAELELLPRAAEGIRSLREAGLQVAVVTNQSGLARGYSDVPTLDRIHARLRDLLAEHGASVDEVFVCPHHPDDACRCRKPGKGLAEQVGAALSADLSRSFVVGDKACDVDLGRGVGATTILVLTGYGDREHREDGVRPDYVASDLREAAEIIRRQVEADGPHTRDAVPAATARRETLGGKLLRAGRGGFLLFFAPPEAHERLGRAFPDHQLLPMRINAPGSQIIFASGTV